MADLFKKLNTLMRASVNDILSTDPVTDKRRVDPAKLGKNIDREISALRERINDALAYEDDLQKQVNTLQSDVETLDRAADEALLQGKQDAARQTIAKMHRAQQHLAMAQSDLEAHRVVARELILRVNELDAAVADARHQENQNVSDDKPEEKNLADTLREVRKNLTRSGETLQKKVESVTPVPVQLEADDEQNAPDDQQAVDSDMQRRLDRLSKK